MGALHLIPTKKEPMKILDRVSGIIRPSRMTLLLGPPGSGKSTLLRALSRKVDTSLNCTGEVIHNEQQIDLSTFKHKSMYISQHDLHHPEMTVRETLNFSTDMFGTINHISKLIKRNKEILMGLGHTNTDFISYVQEAYWITDYVIKLLGLSECAETLIGDAMRRGISGGQKKRVTIGEILVSFSRSFFMDDISNGLDSSTTFEIIKLLNQIAHLMDITMVISLLQPSQETFELFDDLILLCEGQIAYQGPREDVLYFFQHMGFKCPDRKNIADFLQEVTSKMDQAQYWSGNQSEYQYIPISEFVESFKSFPLGRLLEEKLNNSHDVTQNAMPKLQTGGCWNIFKSCFTRETLLFKRNFPVHLFKAIQITLLASVLMTLLLNRKKNLLSVEVADKFLGAFFAGVIIVMCDASSELQMMIRRLPIFYKQRELLHLPGWALLSSTVILSFPISIVETGIWTCLTYFAVGFAPTVIRFFQQLLAFVCIHQMSLALFRFIATVGRTQVRTNTLGTVFLTAATVLGGLLVSKDDAQPWLVWGYWASPLNYGQNAVAMNEFLDERWSMHIHYANIEADTAGKAILRSRGLLAEWRWYWICIGILVGFSVLFNLLSIFALEFLNPRHKHQLNMWPQTSDAKWRRNVDEKAETEPNPNCELVLPFKPVTLVFQHINYYVDMPATMKKHDFSNRLQLLRDVSGAFKPGVLSVLMGVTGAGKTTLLDVLSGRKTGGCIEGTITINGYPKKQETFARVSGYCEQTDVHSPFITVYESLQFSAWLRLLSSSNTQKRNMLVEQVIGLIELGPLRNAMVGLPGVSGLSAEQRKRLTIAVELVSSPSIIFMDEPTSGLDARAAAVVMRAVRKTADTGRTVVCTIHQPNIEIFEAFDELLLMKRGGQLIYSGPLGPLSCNMIQYFQAIPRCPYLRNGQNPAAWMMDITSPAMEYALSVDYADIFENSSLYTENMKQVEELSKKTNSDDMKFASRYEQNFRTQVVACLWKQQKSYWKNPEHNVIRFMNSLSITLLFGAVFWQVGSQITSQQDVFNILGAVYSFALFLGFTTAMILEPVVAVERTVFYRERSAGMYSCMPYAIAQVVVEVQYVIIQVLLFSIILYPMIGFQLKLAKLFWFVLFILLTFIYYILFAMIAVALTPMEEIAAGLSFFIFLFWNLFSGIIISVKMMPVWWRWCYWACPPSWTIFGIVFSQLGDRDELISVLGDQDQTVKEFLASHLGMREQYFPTIVILLIGVIVLFLILFSFCIKHLNFQRR